MKKKYLIITFLIVMFVVFLLGTTSYAGSQKLNHLKYDVTLNVDGSADVIETWEIRVSDTNTLFKTFDIDKSKYGDIIDVTVEEITDTGENIAFRDTGVYAYHVEKGGYYALTRTANKQFEIAWGVSIEDAETKTYQIKYKIYDAIKNYNDCSEFYWQFIGNTNGIPAKNVTGTIKMPKGVSNRENLRVWAHGPLHGNIEIIDDETVTFEVSDLRTETMVEVRIVTTENIFAENENIRGIDRFDKILSEETKWANEANSQRRTSKMIYIVIAVLSFIFIVFYIFKIIKYLKELKKVSKPKEKLNIEYFRDLPDNDATPAEAAFLYYFDKKVAFKSNLPKIMSATILNLALKKVITFEENKKNDVLIVINENVRVEELRADEKNIYDILIGTKEYLQRKNKNKEIIKKISMKDIEKYAKIHDTTFLAKVEGLEEKARKAEIEKGNYDRKLIEISDKWRQKSTAYYTLAICFIAIVFFIVPIFIVIPNFICGYLCGKIAAKTRYLTEKGTDEQLKWKGLKKYMEEFSLLNEREVPELVLWEKYLVFATAFGIADKVLEQLKVKYPQLADESYMMNNGFIYMHMANRVNFSRAINTGVQKAYSSSIRERAASSYSSGGGFGGGFSSGGRRPEAAAAGMGGR